LFRNLVLKHLDTILFAQNHLMWHTYLSVRVIFDQRRK